MMNGILFIANIIALSGVMYFTLKMPKLFYMITAMIMFIVGYGYMLGFEASGHGLMLVLSVISVVYAMYLGVVVCLSDK